MGEKKTKRRIFLDSDELENIDLIFDIVRKDVRNLVPLQTKLLLSRLWCAGEITTAAANNVPMVPVCCNDFDAGLELLHIDSFLHVASCPWSEEQRHFLRHYDITLHVIQKA